MSFSGLAGDGIYLAPSLFPVYGSGGDAGKSSMLGTGIAITGGLKLKNIGIEVGAKRFTLSNEEIGDKSFDSEIKDSIFFGGARLFLNNIFSLKAGLGIHHFEMDLYEGNVHLTNDEQDGSSLGLYGGMGIMHELNKTTDFYYESTLFSVPDVDMYFIDIEVGLRFFL